MTAIAVIDVETSGFEDEDPRVIELAAVIVRDIRKKGGNIGFNAQTMELEDLVASGVIDPAKVVRIAVENACSIAGLILTTECVIADKPKEVKDEDKKKSSNYSGSIE